MALETEGDRATVAEIRAAAGKLRQLADEMEQTGHEVGLAAAAAAAANRGFRLADASVATCGHLKSTINETVRQVRQEACDLDESADHYSTLDGQSARSVSLQQ